eukprot:2911220-Rhodomonas_salina.1
MLDARAHGRTHAYPTCDTHTHTHNRDAHALTRAGAACGGGARAGAGHGAVRADGAWQPGARLCRASARPLSVSLLSLIHISEPTRPRLI